MHALTWLVLVLGVITGCGGASVEPATPPGAGERDVATEDEAQDREGDSATAPLDPVTCGDATCGPDQYCEVRCTCCGARDPGTGGGSFEQSCEPIPAGCATGEPVPNDAVCRQRTVHIPCA
jgi:hypothetical protein